MITSTMQGAEPTASTEPKVHAARIHVVDSDPTVYQSIVQRAQASGLVALTHRSAEEFLAEFTPDALSCVLVDVQPGDARNLTLLREIRTQSPETPIIMMSNHADVSCVMDSLRAGALDFLEKPVFAEELFDRILRALEVGRTERHKHNRRAEVQERIERLTPREYEVMTLLREGRTVKEIAFGFGLSHKTVQVHRARVLKRMGVDSVVLLTNLLNELDIRLEERVPSA